MKICNNTYSITIFHVGGRHILIFVYVILGTIAFGATYCIVETQWRRATQKHQTPERRMKWKWIQSDTNSRRRSRMRKNRDNLPEHGENKTKRKVKFPVSSERNKCKLASAMCAVPCILCFSLLTCCWMGSLARLLIAIWWSRTGAIHGEYRFSFFLLHSLVVC